MVKSDASVTVVKSTIFASGRVRLQLQSCKCMGVSSRMMVASVVGRARYSFACMCIHRDATH